MRELPEPLLAEVLSVPRYRKPNRPELEILELEILELEASKLSEPVILEPGSQAWGSTRRPTACEHRSESAALTGAVVRLKNAVLMSLLVDF